MKTSKLTQTVTSVKEFLKLEMEVNDYYIKILDSICIVATDYDKKKITKNFLRRLLNKELPSNMFATFDDGRSAAREAKSVLCHSAILTTDQNVESHRMAVARKERNGMPKPLFVR